MKICIIGDVHYGAALTLGKKENSTGANTRETDYQNTLLSTIDSAVEKGCTCLVFTGDIFEHRVPTIKQQELFSAALRYAVEAGIKEIHIVVGNHDQQRTTKATTLSYIKELPLINIHVYDEMDMCVLKDATGKIRANLIFMPFRDRRWLDVGSNQEAIEHLDQQLAFHVSSITNSAPKILIGHMTIKGTLWMLEEYADLYNQSANDLILPTEMFKNINITIMGHVHTPGIISKDPLIAYVGSMEKRSASEAHDKKYMIVDLDSKKLLDFPEPCREIYEVKMDFSNALKGDNLMESIYHEIDTFAKDKEFKDAIVKVSISLRASDDKHCMVKDIEKYVTTIYNAFHCVEIKPVLIFSRQVRDENITEHSSDAQSFRRYMENEFKDHVLKANILEIGIRLLTGDAE